MAKENENKKLPYDLEEVAKTIISQLEKEDDYQENVFQIHGILKRVYQKGRSRGERDATPPHLQK